jgi:hypothetical protein
MRRISGFLAVRLEPLHDQPSSVAVGHRPTLSGQIGWQNWLSIYATDADDAMLPRVRLA